MVASWTDLSKGIDGLETTKETLCGHIKRRER
jgi:hypothetical protein